MTITWTSVTITWTSVSQSSFVALPTRLFALLDADNDGAHIVTGRCVVLHVGAVTQRKRPGEPAATRDDLAFLNIQHGRD